MSIRTVLESILALLVLIVLLPVLALVAMAVVIDSPGSPFYRAPRIGKGQRSSFWRDMHEGYAWVVASPDDGNGPGIQKSLQAMILFHA